MPEPTQATWEMLESEQAHAASWKAEYDATFTKLTQLATERDALLEALRQIAGVDARRYNPPLTGHEVIATMRDLARAALRKELRND